MNNPHKDSLEQELEQLDSQNVKGKNKKNRMMAFGKSLTTNHFARLVNGGTMIAIKTGQQLKHEIKQDKKYQICCPYCSQVFLEYAGEGVWECHACGASYDVGGGTSALWEFIAINGRDIYLKGKGKENTAYTRHGFDSQSERQTLAQINMLYWGSRFVLIISLYLLVMVFIVHSIKLSLVFLLLFFSTLLYSMYYAYRAYCLATRQMFIYGRWHFLWWLANVGLLYFLHVGKKPEYQLIVNDFEQAEQDGEFDKYRYQPKD